MKRWLQRAVVVIVAALVAVYVGDWATYKLRGSPHSTVIVQRYLTVPLKGNKQEFDYLGSTEVPCTVSLFSQGDQATCWQLRRNATQNTKP
jgi:hypothetical protein